MNSFARFLSPWLLVGLFLLFAAAPAGASPNTLDLWVRQAGSYGAGNDPGRLQARKLDLDQLQQQEVKHLDVQYEGAFRYRGVPLSAVLATYAPPKGVDLALLRFKNGMIVPLPFRDAAVMGRLDPFIALSIFLPEENKFLRGRFPNIARRVEDYVDVRPIAFAGNKLVVSDRWHPAVPAEALPVFSPWIQVDSLVGIEFVSAAAYYRQFDLSPAAHAGYELFTQSCQFCHGIRKVGASFGWDFVQPIEVSTYRDTGKKLFYHIKYRSQNPSRGELMPALKHISEDQAGLLLKWLQAVAKTPVPEYQP
jgi:mono/diheme cytochrome c family protein